MRMYDGPRQMVAALLASVLFLALFFGAALVWWLALVMAVAVYGAALLLIGRKRALEEIRLSDRVSAADVAAAAEALADASQRLTRAVDRAPEPDRPALADMARDLASIRQSITEDPADFRAARSFINVYLPTMIAAVESYVKVAGQASGDTAVRVRGLGEQIRGFAPVIRRIQTACIENDLNALEVEVAVLSKTLGRS
jgi:hypothetical protein